MTVLRHKMIEYKWEDDTMRKVFKFTSFFCIFSASVMAFAQQSENPVINQENEPAEPVTLTLEQAVEYAKKGSRELKSADIDLEIKRRASAASWNVFFPNIQVSGTMSRASDFTPPTSEIIAYSLGKTNRIHTTYAKEEDRWTTLGNLSASLNLSLAYIQQIRAAKADYESGKITHEQNEQKTLMNIKKLFYGLLVQQESLKIQKASLENARQRMVQAEANFKNGTIPELALLQTQVSYENKKPDIEDAENSLNQQFDTFVFLLGMPVGTKIVLDGSIEPVFVDVNTEDLLAQYGDDSLSIKSMQTTIEYMKLNLSALNLASFTPALALNYGFQPVYTGDNAFKFTKHLNKSSKWHDAGNFSITLALNITNMLPFSANRQKAADLKQNIEKLEITMETLKENQKMEVRKAVDTLNKARAQIEVMDRSVKVAQRAYDMTYRSYRSGMTELLDLRDAETSLNQAKLGSLNQKMQYISALMDLEYNLNTTLTE